MVMTFSPQTSQTTVAINVLLERTEQGRTIARVLEFPDCIAESETRLQAISIIQQLITVKLSSIEIVPLHIPILSPNSSIMQFAGIFKDDPDFAEIADSLQAEREDLEGV
jgi:hypothetical protein